MQMTPNLRVVRPADVWVPSKCLEQEAPALGVGERRQASADVLEVSESQGRNNRVNIVAVLTIEFLQHFFTRDHIDAPA